MAHPADALALCRSRRVPRARLRRTPPAIAVIVTLLGVGLSAGCGAKTGLGVPCEIPLEPAPVDVVFIADHSGTMSSRVPSDSRTFWQALVDSAATVLPQFDRQLALGAALMPADSVSCAALPSLGVALDRRNASSVVRYLRAAGEPLGGTPAFATIELAAQALRARQRAGAPAFIVLGTDGGANCNTAITREECECQSSMCFTPVSSTPEECADSQRVAQQLRALARDGIETIVMGIGFGVPASRYDHWLNELAIAGGRPRPFGSTRFWALDDARTVDTVLGQVLRSLATCRLVVPDHGFVATNDVALRISDRGIVPRDIDHLDGWDWSSIERNQIVVYGVSCDLLIAEHAHASIVTSQRLCTLSNSLRD